MRVPDRVKVSAWLSEIGIIFIIILSYFVPELTKRDKVMVLLFSFAAIGIIEAILYVGLAIEEKASK